MCMAVTQWQGDPRGTFINALDAPLLLPLWPGLRAYCRDVVEVSRGNGGEAC